MPLPPLLTNATVPAPYACHCRLSQSPRPFSTISVRLAALLTFRECHGSFYLFAPQHQRPTANGEAAFFTIRRTSQSTVPSAHCGCRLTPSARGQPSSTISARLALPITMPLLLDLFAFTFLQLQRLSLSLSCSLALAVTHAQESDCNPKDFLKNDRCTVRKVSYLPYVGR